ncbi:MAG: hydroxyacylglutathione hydrolase, partial [Flavobacteriales bacterium]
MKKYVVFLLLFLVVFGCKKDDPIIEESAVPEPYQIVEIESNWFDISYVDQRTYIIAEPMSYEGNVSYLVLGEERAVMFDTGTGENPSVDGTKMKYILDELTSLPVTLLLSHFHYDHNQNVEEFEWVAFPEIPFLQQNISADSIYTLSPEVLVFGTFPEQVHVDEWLPLETDIDLGGKTIQLMNLAGHAEESIVLIDKTNKIAFLGDFLYNGSLFVFDEADLPIYEESANYLLSELDDEYRLFGAHGSPAMPFSRLETMTELLACINNNECTGTSTTVFGEPVTQY